MLSSVSGELVVKSVASSEIVFHYVCNFFNVQSLKLLQKSCAFSQVES